MKKEIEDIKQLSTLFKYVSDSSNVVDDIFVKHKIRFTQPAALNDPLEFNPAIRFEIEGDHFKLFKYNGVSMPSIHDWNYINLIEPQINAFGIFSLTDNPFSFEMWSHYANGHKGFLIEFHIPNKTKPTLEIQEGVKLKAHKVRYVNDYVINIDRLSSGKDSIPHYKFRDAVFLRKTKHWKYEREFRIIRQLTDCSTYRQPKRRTSYRDKKIYLFPFSPRCIANIRFGVNTSRKTKKKIIDSCKNTKIGFLQTVVYKDQRNKIDFIPIEQFGSLERYLMFMPQTFTFDSIRLKYNRNYIKINSLNQLPYYHLQPKDMTNYYKKKLAKRAGGCR